MLPYKDSQMESTIVQSFIAGPAEIHFSINGKRFGDTPARGSVLPARPDVPPQIRMMTNLWENGCGSFRQKCRNFYLQGMFMRDYADDMPWPDEYERYFCTYHDLRTPVLRGYFTWRKLVRDGIYKKVPDSLAYMYIYELLCGIGPSENGEKVSSEGRKTEPSEVSVRAVMPVRERLERITGFEKEYIDSGIGGADMRRNLRRWMRDLAVIRGVPHEIARGCADAEMIARDDALAALRDVSLHTDEEIFTALGTFYGPRLEASPVIKKHGSRGRSLFASIWRYAAERLTPGGRGLFAACFGEQSAYPWHPLSNAVFWDGVKSADTEYILDDCRSYRCRDGVWTEERYEPLYFDKALFASLVRETDRQLRVYLGTGHDLTADENGAWVRECVRDAIEADRLAQIEARKPRIDLAGLGRIRADAAVTRDSLLTEDDLGERVNTGEGIDFDKEAYSGEGTNPSMPANTDADSGPLDQTQRDILSLLVHGTDPDTYMRERHLMPQVVADGINEACFDEIGDTLLGCEDDRLYIIEDYTDDAARIAGA